MRIVGGKYRHRIINWPGDIKITRPTKDRIREAIFSALSYIDGYQSLDLYAGSGAMGIESLSRGCSYCSFVDSSNLAIKTIQSNLKSLDVPLNDYELLAMTDIQALKILKNNNKSFDLVFLDPPYKEGKYNEVIDMLINENLVKEKCIIVCEADHALSFDNNSFAKIKEYKYGPIYVYILWR